MGGPFAPHPSNPGSREAYATPTVQSREQFSEKHSHVYTFYL